MAVQWPLALSLHIAILNLPPQCSLDGIGGLLISVWGGTIPAVVSDWRSNVAKDRFYCGLHSRFVLLFPDLPDDASPIDTFLIPHRKRQREWTSSFKKSEVSFILWLNLWHFSVVYRQCWRHFPIIIYEVKFFSLQVNGPQIREGWI